MQSSGSQRVYGQFHMFYNSCLDGQVGQSVICLVDIGCEHFCCVVCLFYAVHPDLKVLVLVCHYLVWICVCYWLETYLRRLLGLGWLT